MGTRGDRPGYLPTRSSLRRHPLPAWFRRAGLGLLVHWGPYSVPGWAPLSGEMAAVTREQGWPAWFVANPYAEWYLNSMQIPGSPTQRYHHQTYGEGFPYERFAAQFHQESQAWDPSAWAELFQRAGARYVVLTAKHHDGFLLWPSAQPNPLREGYAARRDVVGELARAVNARGMRMGIYYSGGLDWTFRPAVIRDTADLVAAIPQGADYARYVDGHWRELIERYRPAALWNDIGYPAAGRLHELFAAYYNQVPDGVINDRFQQYPGGERLERLLQSRPARRLMSSLVARMIEWGGNAPAAARFRRLSGEHFDFVTPEYRSWKRPAAVKWECTRGIGHSFGYNRNEGPQTMLSVARLVHLLVDVVSKGGNLLLGVGPAADGTVPELQRERLLGLGRWLEVNGEAVLDAGPLAGAAERTAEGLAVRFTRAGDALYAILLERPGSRVTLAGLAPPGQVHLLGHGPALSWEHGRRGLEVGLPAELPEGPAWTVRIGPGPGAEGG